MLLRPFSAFRSRGPARWRGGRCLRLARQVAFFYLLVVIGMMLLEKRLIYFPARWPQGDWSPLTVPREDAWIAAPDGDIIELEPLVLRLTENHRAQAPVADGQGFDPIIGGFVIP